MREAMFPMSDFKCRGGDRDCSFTKKPCLKEACEAYMWDGALVVEKERPGTKPIKSTPGKESVFYKAWTDDALRTADERPGGSASE